MPSIPPHTTGDVARITGVDRSTVHRWITSGILKATETESGIRLISDAELTRFLAKRAVAG